MLSKTAGWGWSFLGRLVNSWGEFLSLLLVVKCSFRISSLECKLRQTLSYLKCQTGTGKLLAELKRQGKFKKCLSTLSICSDEVLLAMSFYSCIIFMLSHVKLDVYVVAWNCSFARHFKARWYWKNGQDLLVGICTTVLPATGWQCLTKKPNHIWGNNKTGNTPSFTGRGGTHLPLGIWLSGIWGGGKYSIVLNWSKFICANYLLLLLLFQ